MNKKRAAYLIFIIVFVLYLIFANRIFTLRGVNHPKRIEFSDLISNSEVYQYLDAVEILDDIYETVIFTGWAFCETDDHDDNKTVQVVFKGRNLTYSFEALMNSHRDDVGRAFPDMNVNIAKTGFITKFSLLNMKNGDYGLYLYVKENDHVFGLANTYKRFTKSGNRLTAFEPRIVKNFRGVNENEDMVYSIEHFSIDENGDCIITGWAAVIGLDSANQAVYIELEDVRGKKITAETIMKQRPDVADHFGDKKYADSGFYAKITPEHIKNDLYTARARVIIENDGLHASEPFIFSPGTP